MADSDTLLFIGIVAFFIILGSALPYIEDDFDQTTSTNHDVQGVSDDLGQTDLSGSTTDLFDVISSIFKMFFWTFGDLPIIMDIFMLIPRILLLTIIVKWIRGV